MTGTLCDALHAFFAGLSGITYIYIRRDEKCFQEEF